MLKAVGNLVIVKMLYKEKEGTLFIPDQAKQYSGGYWGEVMAIGPDYPYEELKVGNKVLTRRHEGVVIDYEEEEYLAMKELFIEGVYEEDK